MYWYYNISSNDLHPTNDKSLSKGAIMTFLLLLPREISSIIVSCFICLYADVELVISLATMSGLQSHLDTLSREHLWNALICTSDKYCQDTCVDDDAQRSTILTSCIFVLIEAYVVCLLQTFTGMSQTQQKSILLFRGKCLIICCCHPQIEYHNNRMIVCHWLCQSSIQFIRNVMG